MWKFTPWHSLALPFPESLHWISEFVFYLFTWTNLVGKKPILWKPKRKRKRKTESEKLPSRFIDHSLKHGYGFIEHSQLVFHSILSAVVFYWCSTETVMDHDIPATASNAGGAFCSANWIVYSFVFSCMNVAKTFTICSEQEILWTLHHLGLWDVLKVFSLYYDWFSKGVFKLKHRVIHADLGDLEAVAV